MFRLLISSPYRKEDVRNFRANINSKLNRREKKIILSTFNTNSGESFVVAILLRSTDQLKKLKKNMLKVKIESRLWIGHQEDIHQQPCSSPSVRRHSALSASLMVRRGQGLLAFSAVNLFAMLLWQSRTI